MRTVLPMAAGAIALAAFLVGRNAPEPEKPPPRSAGPAVVQEVLPPPPPVAARPKPVLPALLASLPFAVTPSNDVLQGTVEVDARPEGSLDELGLLESQRPAVLAFLAARDATLREIRSTVEGRRPPADEADRLCARAQEAHASCMASIRATLLPDQVERFDALVRSGRWGGYTLTIPR
jgi:hypothetical protein